MTSSFVLTTLPPTSDTDPLDGDCTKRNVALPPFGVITGTTTTHPAGTRSGPFSTSTTPTTDNESECDAYDDASIHKTIGKPRTNHTLVACQWTGTPIRAIIPLPRRKLGANGTPQDAAPSQSRTVHDCYLNVPANSIMFGSSPTRLTRSAHVWDDADTDSEVENGDEEAGDGGSDEDCDVAAAARCCSYESITAAEGLSAWSFEELRVECYAQSLVARGTKPPPVVQPALAIPPAFVPRAILRS